MKDKLLKSIPYLALLLALVSLALSVWLSFRLSAPEAAAKDYLDFKQNAITAVNSQSAELQRIINYLNAQQKQ